MTFSAAEILDELAPFQRRTADAALQALHRSPDARFLVADEVGLGKTRVARGVIARTREESERRGKTGLRVVYLSSSLAIAKQNAPLLRCGGDDAVFSTVDRVTMLPTALQPDAALEVLAFTPGTSLSMGGRATGTVRERALLGRLLGSAGLAGPKAERRERLVELLGPPAVKSFPVLYDNAQSRFPDAVLRPFRRMWSTHPLAPKLRAHIAGTEVLLPKRRREVIGALRHVLADACIDLLRADLIVVDEFQRFLDALDTELAVKLLRSAPVLFLSATPFTNTSTENLGLLRLVGLLDPATPGRAKDLSSALADLRDGLLRAGADEGASAREAKKRVEGLLSPLIARTERPQTSANAVDPQTIRVALDVSDVRTFAELDAIGQRTGLPGVVGYWKSASYPLNFMDDYELARRARRANDWPSARLTKAMLKSGSLLPGNPATRALLKHVADEGRWSRPWLAPSLPYVAAPTTLRGTGPATKLLVFTAWTVAPKAIASMVSHDVRTAALRRAPSSRPLQVRPHGPMTELTSLLPSVTLARLIDPINLVRRNGGEALGWNQLRRAAAHALRDRIPSPHPATGSVDRRWYVIAPLLMDDDIAWMRGCGEAAWSGRRSELEDLVAHPEQLGRQPKDLPLVLAESALGPATSVLRALVRHFPERRTEELARHAALIAESFRNLLEQPESLALARRLAPREKHWWRRILRLCVMADLAAVVDEHLAALVTWAPSESNENDDVKRVVRAFREALNLPAVPLRVHVPGGSGRATMTTRAAMRIPTANAAAQERDHVERLRLAFNSPFPPFILATTSVGQEGLDFHLWCHAVVHWNLPRSPIDFEQREGRVDRFRGHVQRRNLAEMHRPAAFAAPIGEPWRALWEAGTDAARAASPSDDGMAPSWVSLGPHRIQRHLPHLPLSAESADIGPLLRRVARYRLTLGQPNPDHLLEVLSEGDAIDEALARELIIDLTPRDESRSRSRGRE
ncbi:MAG TPA: hypothetical protein VK501_12745 [Baekduia sp.]|uniref:hypothetical protein n=1 Tax=Baekduia sp. TaxID=2600305 RepID=UPI002CD8439F|nr:hypothetical protein [Baekduia sp.]HMJ34773.1 hypothetical protein [Baekduia sp.]